MKDPKASPVKLPTVVIVGGGFGGLWAAKRLADAPVRTVVIDRSNHHLFQPLLYQVAMAGLSPADIATPIRSILRSAPRLEVVMDEVIGVDASRNAVLLSDREVPYDYLILATGATHSHFGHEDWAEHAPGLKSLNDATRIRADVLTAFELAEICLNAEHRAALLTFVVVGAGPTGVELAGAIAEIAHRALAKDFDHIDPADAQVILVEAGPRVLAAFPEELSERALESLRRLGVQVRLNTRVEDVDAEGVLTSAGRIPSHVKLWAAGVIASPAAAWLGVEADRAGRVKVGGDCRPPGHANVYVVGDTMLMSGPDGKALPGVAQVAMQQGEYVADRIRAELAGRHAPGPFRYWDKGSMATIGRNSAVAVVGRWKLHGFIAWVAWLLVHIVYLIGFRNRLIVLLQWAWAYLTYERGARLILRPDGKHTPEPSGRAGS